MFPVPHEFTIGGVMMPPLFVSAWLGLVASIITAKLLNRFRLARFFFYPPLVFMAMMVIYTLLIGVLFIGI
ncbi:DUF1656 domain-containing protein [Cerasicoccus maritimus]|uniref:DUF1656 domain-containing protein n=1 Tax=Cerasicoccus maritimus TaxID=490089 RepID=UPI0028526BD5|nr:DUF1656 domain-containing protein [Cerasicoccus maritimus]